MRQFLRAATLVALLIGSLALAAPADAQGAECQGYAVTVTIANGEVPTAGDDVILGTGGVDIIDAQAGNDRVCALGGDDIIHGGSGNDVITGGGGDDVLYGQGGRDTMRGQAGDDRLVGGLGNDKLYGGDDEDIVEGGEGDDRGWGDSGNDDVRGDDGVDRLYGGAGDDTINGGDGDDTMFGQSGHDVLLAEEGDDEVAGGGGDDYIIGGPGNDDMAGDAGDDHLDGSLGDDDADGGDGLDWCEAEYLINCEGVNSAREGFEGLNLVIDENGIPAGAAAPTGGDPNDPSQLCASLLAGVPILVPGSTLSGTKTGTKGIYPLIEPAGEPVGYIWVPWGYYPQASGSITVTENERPAAGHAVSLDPFVGTTEENTSFAPGNHESGGAEWKTVFHPQGIAHGEGRFVALYPHVEWGTDITFSWEVTIAEPLLRSDVTAQDAPITPVPCVGRSGIAERFWGGNYSNDLSKFGGTFLWISRQNPDAAYNVIARDITEVAAGGCGQIVWGNINSDTVVSCGGKIVRKIGAPGLGNLARAWTVIRTIAPDGSISYDWTPITFGD